MIETPRFIVVSGLIGVGKSTFAEKLAGHLGYKAIFEPVKENPYLADFYKDPHKWAYPMQEFLKHRRFAAYQFAAWGIRCGEFPGVVMDRSIHEDTVFAEINKQLGTIDPRNWTTYLQGFQDFQIFMPEPDLYLFLDAPPELCRARAMGRGREEESSMTLDGNEEDGIPLSYMRTLHAGYQRWLSSIAPRCTVAKIDWTKFRSVEQAWAEAEAAVVERTRFTRSLVV